MVAVVQSRLNAVEDILSEADRLSQKIRRLKASRPKREYKLPLSPFTTRVLKLAPQHLHGQFQLKKIARALMEEDKVKVRPPLLKKYHARVYSALSLLKARGLVEQTTRFSQSRLPNRNLVSNEQLVGCEGLIMWALHGGGRRKGIVPPWSPFLKKDEAKSIARQAALRALELHNPAKGSFSTYATLKMSTAIRRAVGKEIRARRRLSSLDARRSSKDERTGHDMRGVPAFDPEAVSDKLAQLIKLNLPKRNLIFWTLHHAYNHSLQDIADAHKCKKQNVKATLNRMERRARSVRMSRSQSQLALRMAGTVEQRA
ncbi:MAG: hypothetical protein V1722_02620 [Candidatus Micrarchaeota archaeon]